LIITFTYFGILLKKILFSLFINDELFDLYIYSIRIINDYKTIGSRFFFIFNNTKDLDNIFLHVLSQTCHALVYLYSHTDRDMAERIKEGSAREKLFHLTIFFFQ